MMLIGVRVDPGDDSASLIGHPSLHRPFADRGRLAGTGEHNSDEAQHYADAVERWHQFDNLPEHAYALLGHGRCLIALNDPAADVPLAQARDLFTAMGYKPALAETETLLTKAAPLGS